MLSSVSQPSPRTRLQPGTRIGSHLRIRSVLGQGGTAIVYEAEHLKLRSTVALKVAHRNDDGAARLQREGQVCASLVDARIPRVFDMGELEDGRPYLVMEKIEGETLEQELKTGALSSERALGIARDVLRALETVHRSGIVHRDVKPANLILRDDEHGCHVHLMDFGVSKTMRKTLREVDITRPGTVVGTPLYMAPEQFDTEPLDVGVDLYAVGVILYEMLSGRPPFGGHSTAEVVVAVLRRDYPSLASCAPRLSTEILTLVERAMSERATDRFATARAMREAVEQALASRIGAAPRTTYVPERARRSRALWASLGLGTVALGACVLLLRTPAPAAQPHEALPAASAPPIVTPEAPAPGPQAPPPSPTSARSKRATRPQAAASAQPAGPQPPVARKAHARPQAHVPQHEDPAALLDRSMRELEALRGVLEAPEPTPAP